MCDTFVIMGPYTATGKTLFAKNSDRAPDEVQNVIFIPGSIHKEEKVQCTYRSVPQAERTFDVILSKPFWMWGAEMGINQFGVAIGNEAVFTTEPLKDEGLLGMDMTRLALERKATASEALDFIITLLETYGQGGPCGYRDSSMSYHNSWIIADPSSAFVLETAGDHWVWKRVEKNYSISNILTIGRDFDGISDNAIRCGIENDECQSESDFSFKNVYKSRGFNMQTIQMIAGKGRDRRELHYSQASNLADNGSATVRDCMNILRSHQPAEGLYEPSRDGSNSDVCWHAAGIFRPDQSVNSLIAELSPDLTHMWTTCGSAPCIQIYRPLILSRDYPNGIPSVIRQGDALYSADATWWKNELLHREVLLDYTNRLRSYQDDRDFIEEKWLLELSEIEDFADKCAYTDKAFQDARLLVEVWIDRIRSIGVSHPAKWLYRRFWRKLNKEDKIPVIEE